MFNVCYSINRDCFMYGNAAYNKFCVSLIGFSDITEAV